MMIEKYLDKFWVAGEYDCWGLVRDVYKTELGIQLPPIIVSLDGNKYSPKDVLKEFKNSDCYRLFKPIFPPVDFCVCLMGIVVADSPPVHIGVYYQGRILHNEQHGTVVFETIHSAKSRWSLKGYYQCLS